MVAVEHHVAVLRWPEEEAIRAALRSRSLPRLLVVAVGATPPLDVDRFEDWVFASANAAEIDARMSALQARAERSDTPSPVIDDDDVLRVGSRWVALGPIEARIARALAERAGELVPRAELQNVAWEGRAVRANTIDRQLHRLRGHMALVGLALVTVRGRGYILELASNLA